MKDFEFTEYYVTYGALLTDRQKKLVEGYYLYDLSLSELAEEFGGSRQSVYDAIKKARVILSQYEEKLKICELRSKFSALADDIKNDYPAVSEKIDSILRG